MLANIAYTIERAVGSTCKTLPDARRAIIMVGFLEACMPVVANDDEVIRFQMTTNSDAVRVQHIVKMLFAFKPKTETALMLQEKTRL